MEIRYIIIAVLSVLFIVCGCPTYLADPSVSVWLKAMSYHLFHANVFHLAANCLSVWYVFKVVGTRTRGVLLNQLVVGFIIATITYFTATRPVVGISNILFAVFGLRTPSLSSPWWKSRNTIIFFAVTIGMLFFPQFSALTHIISFICGAIIAAAKRALKSLDDDSRRAIGK